MATPQLKSSVPDITPISEWSDGRLWEDFAAEDIDIDLIGKWHMENEVMTFYSYEKPVVEADVTVSHIGLDRIAFIDDLTRPAEYEADEFGDEGSHFISAFKTIFFAFQLDSDIRKINATPSDIKIMQTVLRAGIPEGWSRELVSGETEATTQDWEQAWEWLVDGDNLTVSYERKPELVGLTAGGLALVSSVEIQAT